MSQTQTLTDEQLDSFLASLDDTSRRVVAYFIDGEVVAAGYPSTRPGSKVYLAAQDKAISTIIRSELDLGELAPDIVASIDAEGDNEQERDIQRDARVRIGAIARYLEP